jgi:hypothetical protein
MSQPSRQGFNASEAAGRWMFQPLTGALSIPLTRTLFGKKVIVAELGSNVFPFTAIFLTLNPWVPLHMHMWPYLVFVLCIETRHRSQVHSVPSMCSV